MANRLEGNIVIVDSAMGNALVLTSANRVININHFSVNAFGFLATDTTSVISLSGVDTTNIVYSESFVQGGSGGAGMAVGWDRFKFRSFGTPQRFSDLKVPTLTAGTGYIYLA